MTGGILVLCNKAEFGEWTRDEVLRRNWLKCLPSGRAFIFWGIVPGTGMIWRGFVEEMRTGDAAGFSGSIQAKLQPRSGLEIEQIAGLSWLQYSLRSSKSQVKSSSQAKQDRRRW